MAAGTSEGVVASSDGLEMLQDGSQDMGKREKAGKNQSGQAYQTLKCCKFLIDPKSPEGALGSASTPVSSFPVRSLRREGQQACRASGARPFPVRGGVLSAGNGVVDAKTPFEALRRRRRLPGAGRTKLGSCAGGGRREVADVENGRSVGVPVRAQSDERVGASSKTFRRRPALPVASEGRESALQIRLVLLFP